MGQQVSAEEQKKRASQIPYTKYSQPKQSGNEKVGGVKLPQQGITVVNPDPDSFSKSTKPMELQKLEKVHRFWPILKSSIDSLPPQEKILDGVGYKLILEMCQRFQFHIGESAKIVSSEQQALASRLRDIEMFSAGIAQQVIRTEERLHRVKMHLQKVNEVEKALEDIHMALAHCIPLAQSLNNMLPEQNRLETFKLHPPKPHPPQENTDQGVDWPEQESDSAPKSLDSSVATERLQQNSEQESRRQEDPGSIPGVEEGNVKEKNGQGIAEQGQEALDNSAEVAVAIETASDVAKVTEEESDKPVAAIAGEKEGGEVKGEGAEVTEPEIGEEVLSSSEGVTVAGGGSSVEVEGESAEVTEPGGGEKEGSDRGVNVVEGESCEEGVEVEEYEDSRQ